MHTKRATMNASDSDPRRWRSAALTAASQPSGCTSSGTHSANSATPISAHAYTSSGRRIRSA
jgi:hypothetical protein